MMLGKLFKRVFPSILAVLLLIGAIGLSTLFSADQAGGFWGQKGDSGNASSKQKTPEDLKDGDPSQELLSINGEMRAVWVPFMSLNMQDTDKSEQAFKTKFDDIIAQAKQRGLNTLIVHVRSHGDAMYPSEYYPWSHLLTGTQGQNPGYDPLAYMVKATHDAGMQFHAWINPLRVQVNGAPEVLAESNPYQQWRNDADSSNDHWVLDYNGDKYYNPAVPEVRERIIQGVKEIVSNYPVDAIHFDDYFYPTTDPSYDQISYDAYKAQQGEEGQPLSLADWRTTNINTLISGVYSGIKSVNPQVQFGISPQGNISNDIGMGADVHSWGSQTGYVDYLCPQLYVNFDHPLLPFNKMADEWCALVTNPNIKLYFGLGVYKIGSDADNGTWNQGGDIIKRQVEYGRNVGSDGFMLYSWEYLNQPQTEQEMNQVMSILE